MDKLNQLRQKIQESSGVAPTTLVVGITDIDAVKQTKGFISCDYEEPITKPTVIGKYGASPVIVVPEIKDELFVFYKGETSLDKDPIFVKDLPFN